MIPDDPNDRAYRALAASVLAQAWEEIVSGRPALVVANESVRKRTLAAWQSYVSAVEVLLMPDCLWTALVGLEPEVLAERAERILRAKFGPHAAELGAIARRERFTSEAPAWWVDLRHTLPGERG